MSASSVSTVGRVSADVGRGVSLDKFAVVKRAITQREQIWAYLKGQGVRLCPHALGWRGDELYVLGLILQQRRERIADGDGWDWLMEWQWLRLADLEIPFARKGEWVTCPREQRPPCSFLTHLYCEAA